MENFSECSLRENLLEMYISSKDSFSFWMYDQVGKLYNTKVKQNMLAPRLEMEI